MERHQVLEESSEVTPRFLIDYSVIRPLLRGKSVLEVEPGTGRALSLLREEGFETQDLTYETFLENEQIPRDPGSVDCVFSRYVLERSLNLGTLARESFRVANRTAVHLVSLKSLPHGARRWDLNLIFLRKALPDWEIQEVPETDCALIWRENLQIWKQDEPSGGESGGHDKVPRKETVERDGQTHEQIYWVVPDWFKDTKNLEGMSDEDVGKTYHSMQGLLADRHQAVVDAQKAGASGEELEKLKLGEHNAYWGRRHLGREVKRRGLPSDMAPVRTAAREKAVESRGEEIVPDHPSGSVARAIQEVGLSQAEENRYTGERVTGNHRAQAFNEFLDGRDVPIDKFNAVFPRAWGSFRDAPLAVNAAMGEMMGYSLDELEKHMPAFARAKHDRATIEKGAQYVKDVLPAVAAWSRNYYKQQGKDTIEVYRGVRGGPADAIGSQLGRGGGSVDMGANPVSQWVTDKKFADAAAKGTQGGGAQTVGKGYVISMEVPVDRVVFSREATKPLDHGEAPEVLINTGFDEVFRVPKESIEQVE